MKLKNIELIAYDFDGVMTDNKVYLSQDGTEAVVVNRADGLGVDMIRSMGIPQMIISTEANPVVKARADKLGLDVIQNCSDKKQALVGYCRKENIDISKVMFVGNDLNDLEVMRSVGYPVAPADAHHSVKALSCLVTEARGGEGVIRELAEKLDSKKT